MQISVLMVRALAGVVERAGVGRERFLAAAGLDPQLIDDGSVRLPVNTYQRCVDAALAVSGDPAFGLHIGEHANSAMFDVLGHLAEHAATLRESIEAMTRYSMLVAEGHEPRLHEADDLASVRFPTLRGDIPAMRMTAEFAVSAFLIMLRQFAGHRARPTHVSFAYPTPKYVAEYERLFGKAVRFDQPVTEAAFPRAWLDKPQLYRSPDLYSVLKAEAERGLGRLARDAALTERVERVLAAHVPDHVTMDDVARELGMSARSLRRQLSVEGANYSDLVERGRIRAAKRMLEDPRISIQEIAYAMGFAAPAAFHRAFKRWTGMTPKQYRETF